MSIIFFIITFVLVIVFLILSIFGRLIYSFFRILRRGGGQQSHESANKRGYTNGSSNYSESSAEKDKVFSKNEGEYVSYEEVE